MTSSGNRGGGVLAGVVSITRTPVTLAAGNLSASWPFTIPGGLVQQLQFYVATGAVTASATPQFSTALFQTDLTGLGGPYAGLSSADWAVGWVQSGMPPANTTTVWHYLPAATTSDTNWLAPGGYGAGSEQRWKILFNPPYALVLQVDSGSSVTIKAISVVYVVQVLS